MTVFNGTFASDRLSGGVGNDKIYGSRGDDSLYGGAGNDLLKGGAGHDWLSGDDGNDQLLGGSGEDGLYGGMGKDLLDGGNTGSDYDSVYYFGTVGVTVNFATGVAIDEFGTTDTLIDIESVNATAGADTLIGGNKANDDFESFRGYAGNDYINGGSGFDRADYGRDYNKNTGEGRNGIVADLAAGTARDGFGDTDTLKNIEAIRASAFADDLRGDAKANRFEPLSGSDYIDGRGGRDEVAYHNDIYYREKNGGTQGIKADLREGEVRDTSGWHVDTVVSIENVRGSVLNDEIRGDNKINKLRGDRGDDFIAGRQGNDKLLGEDGQDTILGGKGKDMINGGSGNDSLRGGQGVDTFVFEKGSDIDRVRDFQNGVDRLDVSDFGFASAADVISNARKVGNNVMIELNDDDFIILQNFQLAALDAGDLIL